MKKIIATLLLLALVIGGLAAIAGRQSTHNSSAATTVTATYYPLYDFTRNIGGQKTKVVDMTPSGVEPHDFEPSARALAEAQKTQLFVYNGYLEPWATAFLQSYKHVAVNAAQNIELNTTAAKDRPGQKTLDPHFWLDPVLAGRVVDTIRHGLNQADPANKNAYNKNAAIYKTKLTALDADFQKGLADCSSRIIVTSHAAFGYTAERYHLNMLPITGLSPETEPSPAKLAELSRLVKEQGIRYIFFESLVSPHLAQTIARETGAKTLVLDPIEGVSETAQKQGKDYIVLQRQNLHNLRLALGCK